ncbi:nuclear GTPase SLIP-GC-like [Elgaria multicarinata webbii]|uniref:nuclear GTPase SLIP-GC-like n=1 Tax=Elgaria multicarinata webbii TaxID=159646 RepID=UPI002FCCC6C2
MLSSQPQPCETMATGNPNASPTVTETEDNEMELLTEEPRGAEEDSTAETPRKRRRREDKYQVFESREKEILKKYEKLESKTRKVLSTTYDKLFAVLSQDTMLDGVNYLKERLITLKKKCSLDPIFIGFLGRTGAGKTSLLNAIIGKKLFMPVSGEKACTSCIVQVKKSKSEFYEAVIHLLTKEEWSSELKDLVEVLSKNGGDDEGSSHESVSDAKDKLCALYGAGADQKSYEELLKAKLVTTIPAKRTISIKEKEVTTFSEKLGPYICVKENHSFEAWPLIKYVELDIPASDLVPEGITFVDIPGTGDFNKKRDEMWKETPIENKHDAILERNQDVKKKKERSIREKLQRKLLPDADVLNKDDLVYTVSAKQFWKRKHLSEEETEIPKLREYIRRIYLKEKERLVTDFVTETLGIHLLAENIGSEQQFVERHFQESGVEQFVNEKIDALGEKLESLFTQMKQPLCDGVTRARRSYKKILEEKLTRNGGNQGFHKVLKAVCLKNGVYASRTFARIDFNEDLARPIYDNVENIFENIFRIQKGTRCNLWPHLEGFKNEVQEKISQIARNNKIPEDNGKIKAFIHETNVIMTKLRAEILQQKIVIYQSLKKYIQFDLMPYFEEASTIRGPEACDQMKTILRDNIDREVKKEIESCFLELKEKIMTTLKKETSIVLKLLLLHQDQLAVKLPGQRLYPELSLHRCCFSSLQVELDAGDELLHKGSSSSAHLAPCFPHADHRVKKPRLSGQGRGQSLTHSTPWLLGNWLPPAINLHRVASPRQLPQSERGPKR